MCWNTTSGQLVYEILDSLTRSAYWNFPRTLIITMLDFTSFRCFVTLCTLFVVIDYPSSHIFNFELLLDDYYIRQNPTEWSK